jgi:hypothetical protein
MVHRSARVADMAWELVCGGGRGNALFLQRFSRNRDVLVSYRKWLDADLERRYG